MTEQRKFCTHQYWEVVPCIVALSGHWVVGNPPRDEGVYKTILLSLPIQDVNVDMEKVNFTLPETYISKHSMLRR